ncbi:MAG: Gfo/Idh/MocA family protein [Vicinamibacterales bacterium]
MMRTRVAVVGVGHLGRHHARILSTLPDVELVGVADRDPDRAASVASQYGVVAHRDASAFLEGVDAAVVAVPTEAHAEVAVPLLERGVSVLVEKPLAGSLAEADLIIGAAARSGATLAVGHTERHNPAVRSARLLIDRPRFIEAHRLGTFPERSLDIDVVFDVMIHDLDVVASLVGTEVVSLEAVGVPVLTQRIDIANVRLRFADGCIANLTASRISRDRVRKIRFFQQDAYISIDYASQEVEQYRLARGPDGRPVIGGGRVAVDRQESLKLEIEDFLLAVRSGEPPLVTGDEGRRAVALANEITARMATKT